MNSQYAVLNHFSPYGGFPDPGGLIHPHHTLPHRIYSPPSLSSLPSPHRRPFRKPRHFSSNMSSMLSQEEMAAMQRLSDNYVPDIQVSRRPPIPADFTNVSSSGSPCRIETVDLDLDCRICECGSSLCAEDYGTPSYVLARIISNNTSRLCPINLLIVE